AQIHHSSDPAVAGNLDGAGISNLSGRRVDRAIASIDLKIERRIWVGDAVSSDVGVSLDEEAHVHSGIQFDQSLAGKRYVAGDDDFDERVRAGLAFDVEFFLTTQADIRNDDSCAIARGCLKALFGIDHGLRSACRGQNSGNRHREVGPNPVGIIEVIASDVGVVENRAAVGIGGAVNLRIAGVDDTVVAAVGADVSVPLALLLVHTLFLIGGIVPGIGALIGALIPIRLLRAPRVVAVHDDVVILQVDSLYGEQSHAEDVLRLCDGLDDAVWLGMGSGPVGLALAYR